MMSPDSSAEGAGRPRPLASSDATPVAEHMALAHPAFLKRGWKLREHTFGRRDPMNPSRRVSGNTRVSTKLRVIK